MKTRNMILFLLVFFIISVSIIVLIILRSNRIDENLENVKEKIDNIELEKIQKAPDNLEQKPLEEIQNIDNIDTNINSAKGKTIVIDPGHQQKGNSEQEPIGPGSTQTKAKVTGGATGISTGQNEYELNLKVALKLKNTLERKGYNVIMTRSTNNVNISNSERAQIANDSNADAFIRIHANSSDNSSVKGVLTMCQTSQNMYNGYLADESYNLSKNIVDSIASITGTQNRGITRTDDMSGINWCKIPTTIVEMGFLSNADEDKLLSDDSYQNKIVEGIITGLEKYLEQ